MLPVASCCPEFPTSWNPLLANLYPWASHTLVVPLLYTQKRRTAAGLLISKGGGKDGAPPSGRRTNARLAGHMGLKPQSVGSSGGPMSSQSRISAWFVVLVALAGTVFLLEYAVFFTSGSEDDGAASTLGENWRLPQPAPRRQPEPLDRTVPAAAAAQPRHQVASVARPRAEEEEEADTGRRKKLAVVVPAHAGDLEKALNSLKDWPTKCHPNTLANADLVLYYAGGAEDNVEAVLPSLAATGGRCFANTRLVLANLSEEVRWGFCVLFADSRISPRL